MHDSASAARDAHRICATNLAIGFAAGFAAVLVFHQLTVGAMYAVGVTQNAPYSLQAVAPYGVPRVVSTAFWGGVWGALLAGIRPWLPRAAFVLLISGFAFGIVGPTFYGWFVLAPRAGRAVANGFQLASMWRGMAINGMWGLGCAAFLLVADWARARRR